MGITFNDACMLWKARLDGTSFANTLTIGHQTLALHPKEVRWFQKEYKNRCSEGENAPLSCYKFHDYADEFLTRILGAEQVSTVDYSTYENATIVHDMNSPISEQFFNKFDAVIDGGTLEHVFNIPVALQNLANVTKPGGSIFITVPSNNLCGHGLYQFSPELFFRYFSDENGFQLKGISLFESRFSSIELSRNKVVYQVSDPKVVRGRVGYSNRKPTTIMVHAIKRDIIAGNCIVPLQSDYVQIWNEKQSSEPVMPLKNILKAIYPRLPHSIRCLIFSVRCLIFGYIERQRLSLHNKRHFHL
jgi:SAM-dependent methyltransferase